MHLLLTDRLSCPRCGPDFGLILRADRLENRVVYEGVLGCPNCRDSFPIVDGFGDLRAPPRGALASGLAGSPQEDEDVEGDAERLAALLGVVRGPGTLALIGEPARCAAQIAAAVEDVHMLALDSDMTSWPEMPRVSRLASGPGIPVFSRSLRGIAIDGRLGTEWLREAARVVAPMSRVVVTHAPGSAQSVLEGEGLSVLVAEAETVVAARG